MVSQCIQKRAFNELSSFGLSKEAKEALVYDIETRWNEDLKDIIKIEDDEIRKDIFKKVKAYFGGDLYDINDVENDPMMQIQNCYAEITVTIKAVKEMFDPPLGFHFDIKFYRKYTEGIDNNILKDTKWEIVEFKLVEMGTLDKK